MNRAQNSDFKTHAEKSNPTSRTDFSSKTLWDIFLGHPVCFFKLESPKDSHGKDSQGQCQSTIFWLHDNCKKMRGSLLSEAIVDCAPAILSLA